MSGKNPGKYPVVVLLNEFPVKFVQEFLLEILEEFIELLLKEFLDKLFLQCSLSIYS